MSKCIWNCGRQTKNRSGICDACWRAAELLRSNTDAGYRAWVERKRAKATSEARKAHLEKARALKQAKTAYRFARQRDFSRKLGCG
jgi:hypothetical protein